MADELQTVATYSYPIQAQLAKVQLEAQGIECFLSDMETVYANTFLTNAIGGVKVQVYDADAFRARAVLESWEREALRPAEAGNRPHCPDCYSQETRRVTVSRPMLALLLLIVFLFFVFHNPAVFFLLFYALFLGMCWREWKCDQCGHRWRVAR